MVELRRTHRITVTETILRQIPCNSVLEIGASDYSFEDVRPHTVSRWVKLDFRQPCDVECDLNDCALRVPLPDAAFDLVLCTEVLEHLLRPDQLLREAHRLLRTKGNILVSVPNSVSLSYRLAWLAGHIPSCAASANLPPELGGLAHDVTGRGPLGGHVIDFNRKRCFELIRRCGFSLVKVKGSGIIWHWQVLPHWLVPAGLSSNIICLARKLP